VGDHFRPMVRGEPEDGYHEFHTTSTTTHFAGPPLSCARKRGGALHGRDGTTSARRKSGSATTCLSLKLVYSRRHLFGHDMTAFMTMIWSGAFIGRFPHGQVYRMIGLVAFRGVTVAATAYRNGHNDYCLHY
jgi:hypothetical protein